VAAINRNRATARGSLPVGAAARLQMLAECLAPLADRVMADDDAMLGEQILNVAKAEVDRKYSQTA
jgi:hypothetical protein